MTHSHKSPYQIIMSAFQLQALRHRKVFNPLLNKTCCVKGQSWHLSPHSPTLLPEYLTGSHGLRQPRGSRLRRAAKHNSTGEDAITLWAKLSHRSGCRSVRGWHGGVQGEQGRGASPRGGVDRQPARTSWPAWFIRFLALSSTCVAPEEHKTQRISSETWKENQNLGTNRPPRTSPLNPLQLEKLLFPAVGPFCPIILKINVSLEYPTGFLHLKFSLLGALI